MTLVGILDAFVEFKYSLILGVYSVIGQMHVKI